MDVACFFFGGGGQDTARIRKSFVGLLSIYLGNAKSARSFSDRGFFRGRLRGMSVPKLDTIGMDTFFRPQNCCCYQKVQTMLKERLSQMLERFP